MATTGHLIRSLKESLSLSPLSPLKLRIDLRLAHLVLVLMLALLTGQVQLIGGKFA